MIADPETYIPEPIRNSPCRRFNLGDCLLLICALSITLVSLRSNEWFIQFPGRVRFWWDGIAQLLNLSPWSTNMTRDMLARLVVADVINSILVEALSCVLAGLTLVVPLIRLRRPRPPRRNLLRQPGFVACIAVIVATVVMADLEWLRIARFSLWMVLCLALILLWPVLALRPWSPEPTWIDRLGRAVGLGWIIVTVSATTLNYL